jgi:hypothetical protein
LGVFFVREFALEPSRAARQIHVKLG